MRGWVDRVLRSLRRVPDPLLARARGRLLRIEKRIDRLESEVAEGYRER